MRAPRWARRRRSTTRCGCSTRTEGRPSARTAASKPCRAAWIGPSRSSAPPTPATRVTLTAPLPWRNGAGQRKKRRSAAREEALRLSELKRAGFFRAVSPSGETVEIEEDVAALLDAGRAPAARGGALRRPRGVASGDRSLRGERVRALRKPRRPFRRERPNVPPRPALSPLQSGLPGSVPGPLRLQLPSGRLHGVPGLRPDHFRGPGQGDSRPRPRARGSSGRALEHPGVRVRLPRPLPRLPAVFGPRPTSPSSG